MVASASFRLNSRSGSVGYSKEGSCVSFTSLLAHQCRLTCARATALRDDHRGGVTFRSAGRARTACAVRTTLPCGRAQSPAGPHPKTKVQYLPKQRYCGAIAGISIEISLSS